MKKGNQTTNYTLTITRPYMEDTLDFTDLDVDNTNLIIVNLVTNTSVSDILSRINTTGEKTMVDGKTGGSLTSNEKIKTGDKVTVELSDITYTYTLSVKGDVNEDGNVGIGDLAKIARHQIEGNLITEQYMVEAADVNRDGKIAIGDLAKLSRYLLNGGVL